MFNLEIPAGELVLRGVIIYVFLQIVMRFAGKKQIGEMAPFDLVMLLVLSECVQNALVGEERSIFGGMILVSTLVGLNYLLTVLTYYSRRAESVIEGEPVLLVRDGKMLERACRKQKVTKLEIETAIRGKECRSLDEVDTVILENDGSISVFKKKES